MAHLRYISRPTAVLEVASAGLPTDSHRSLQKALRGLLEARAGAGGKVGRRVAEKMIISLPNDWPSVVRLEAMQRIIMHVAPAGSGAAAIAYSHGDTPNNSHFHLLAVDGLESIDAARMRRPSAQRIRRRDVIRLGDRGRPKALRFEIASIINDVANEAGLSGVEWRSFKDRGIPRMPGRHESPEQRARVARASSKPRPVRRRGRMARTAALLESQRMVRLGQSIFDMVDAPPER